jgi:hypothetical protein
MNLIVKRLKTLNNALPGLILGIILIGAVEELTIVWFVPDKIQFTVGLWIGVGLAIYMSIHMAFAIRSATDFRTEKQAKATAILHAILRYAVVAVILFLTAYFKIGYILASLLGVMNLKFSAYLQPTLNKFVEKRR